MSAVNENGQVLSCVGGESGLMMGGHILRFEDVELGEEFEKRAREELRETPEVVKESIEQLRELLAEVPALNYPRDNDEKLKVYLRPCKYYPESALQRMKTFYKFKVKNPKYYAELLPSKQTKAFEQSLLTVLPQRNKNGERVLIVEAGGKWDTKGCGLQDILRCVMLILEAALSEPRTQISGVHVIIDMKGLTLQHVWQFTPSFAKTVVDWVQECIPLRLKGVHIVNQPYIFNMVFSLFKPLLGEKLRKRIMFHGTNFDVLHSHIDRAILPIQYDGTQNIPSDLGERFHKYICHFENEYVEKLPLGYSSVSACC